MCGIFGFVSSGKSKLSYVEVRSIVDELFELSESRGKESSGIAIKSHAKKTIEVLKESIPASQFIKSKGYQNLVNDSLKKSTDQHLPFTLIAHARLVTNGTQENNNNNQPVIKDGQVAVHNGIITNVDDLWSQHPDLERNFEVDTESMLALLKDYQNKGNSLSKSIHHVFGEIYGTASTSILSANSDVVVLATNNASLYYTIDTENEVLLFASEAYILDTAIKNWSASSKLALSEVKWSTTDSSIILNNSSFEHRFFKYNEDQLDQINVNAEQEEFEIINHSPDEAIDFKKVEQEIARQHDSKLSSMLEFNLEAINELKRCSKCLLPETFPYIKYDEDGECNYCKRYIPKKQGEKEGEFKALMEKYKSKDGTPDCIIPFSGGRDSSYGLHYIVKELGLNPITYTYDWGMVTDLARRNIARVCGKLGIENIIVSADIHKKRENIRKNVEAWLKKPQLGMIPLFMAGDKQFFYYVNQIKKQTGIKMDIWSTNILENTDFKVGFCGISPSFDKTRPDYLPFKSKVGLASYYMKNFLTNPAYLNSSLIDTVASFYAYYAEPRNHFYQLFDWIKWDEKKIEQTLFDEYNWEVSPDTTSTWRIGDGTAAFYNYIYYTVAGFSEFDTFRSNQIREGLITREEGLKFINQENQPRFDSLKWYLEIIGVDFEKAISIVNKIPKRYPQ